MSPTNHRSSSSPSLLSSWQAQRECSELRRELDDATKVQQEQLEQLAALKAKYDQLCRERDAFRKALEEQLTLNPAFCVMPDLNTEH